MIPLKLRLENYKKAFNAKWEIVEQDYVLSIILSGMASIPELRNNLIFKGGTCLRKCYFGDYRFSQDIDLSVMQNHEMLKSTASDLFERVCKVGEEKIQDLGEGFYLNCSPYQEKHPHPEGQQAFVIQAKFPWNRDYMTKVYVEITFSEKVILPAVERGIIHPYGEKISETLMVYDLNEIVAEKIRALLQFSKKLHERGWGRSRVRDYYDLWRIFGFYSSSIDQENLLKFIRQKCEHKDISFHSIDDIFNDKLMKNVEEEWESWLEGIIIPPLPQKEVVFSELKKELDRILR